MNSDIYNQLTLYRSCIFPGFTRMVLSLWAMTILSLYIRVQVNILGRHLYIDTARGLGSSLLIVRAIYFPTFSTCKLLITPFCMYFMVLFHTRMNYHCISRCVNFHFLKMDCWEM